MSCSSSRTIGIMSSETHAPTVQIGLKIHRNHASATPVTRGFGLSCEELTTLGYTPHRKTETWSVATEGRVIFGEFLSELRDATGTQAELDRELLGSVPKCQSAHQPLLRGRKPVFPSTSTEIAAELNLVGHRCLRVVAQCVFDHVLIRDTCSRLSRFHRLSELLTSERGNRWRVLDRMPGAHCSRLGHRTELAPR